MLAAVVWHYWIAVILIVFGVIPVIVGMVAAYLKKTQAPKYGMDE